MLIKLHDMRNASSEELFIVKKSNGQYAKLTRAAGIEAILGNGKEHEELRSLLFDLTYSIQVPSQQIMFATGQEQLDQLQYSLPDVKRVD